MKVKSPGLVQACNIVAAVSLLTMIIFQLLPFWYNGEVVSSIQQYVWFPRDNKALDGLFKELTENRAFRVNDIMLMPVLVMASSVLGLIFCTLKSRSIMPAVFPAICGVIGIVGYLTSPVFQAFEYWWIHVALCGEMILVAALTFYVGLAQNKKK